MATTTDAPKKPKTPTAAKATEYVVLMLPKAGATEGICVVGRASGVTDVKAIEAAFSNSTTAAKSDGAAFVAVPARSWRERQEKVNTIVRKSWT